MKEENKGSEMSKGINSTKTENEEECSSLAPTNEEKPIGAEQLESGVSQKDGIEIPVIKASDESQIQEKLVEDSAGSILVEKKEEEKCDVVEGEKEKE